MLNSLRCYYVLKFFSKYVVLNEGFKGKRMFNDFTVVFTKQFVALYFIKYRALKQGGNGEDNEKGGGGVLSIRHFIPSFGFLSVPDVLSKINITK